MESEYICTGFPELIPDSWIGRILPLLPSGPADFQVTARGSCFHFVTGEHSRGKYFCIPDWGICMDYPDAGDRYWNLTHLMERYPKLRPVDAVSIICALAAIHHHYLQD